MKIGVVTVHDSSNLGSFLQAFSMQELIKQHGDDPVIIKTRSSFTTFCLYLGYNNARAVRSLKRFLFFLLQCTRDISNLKKRYQKYKKYKKDWDKFEQIISVSKANTRIKLDVLLLGSDEIWNVNQPAFQNPYLYGDGIKSDKKIAYAVSLGNATVDKMKLFPHLIDKIKLLNAVFYRDERTQSVLADCGVEVNERVCDPTIQIDIKKYMKSIDEVDLPDAPYIAVYSYIVTKEHKSWIQRFARENNLKTLAVSLPQEWCDAYMNCSPLEFGAVLEKAKYVYTTTFHGTIFSALYHKNFVATAILPKVSDVLQLLGLEKHSIPENCSYDTFSHLLKCEYCFEEMEKILFKLRGESYRIYEKAVRGIEYEHM